jgi:tetratricopeptide (TPR) repeat protein
MKKVDFSQAELCFKKAIKLNPYNCLVHVNLGTVYANQKKYKESIDEFFLVRNLDGWYPGLQDQMYQIIMATGSEFEDWVDREPNNSEAHYYYSFYLYYDHDRDDAVDELDEAIKLNSKEEKYYLARAAWLWNLDEYEESIADCKKCLEINPNNWKCHNQIAINYSYSDDIIKAIEHFKKSVEIDSLVIESQFHLGESYFINKEYQQSIDALNKAVRLGHKAPFAYYDLAFDYYHLDDFESAMQNAIIAKNKDSVQKRLNEKGQENLDWLLNELQQKINQK